MTSTTKVLSFDWKENPDEVIDSFKEALREFGIFVIEIDTQSDTLAVVIGDQTLTGNEAMKAYSRVLRE